MTDFFQNFKAVPELALRLGLQNYSDQLGISDDDRRKYQHDLSNSAWSASRDKLTNRLAQIQPLTKLELAKITAADVRSRKPQMQVRRTSND